MKIEITPGQRESLLDLFCTEVKAYYRRVTEYELTAQAVERAYRIRKQRSRKYKGGAM